MCDLHAYSTSIVPYPLPRLLLGHVDCLLFDMGVLLLQGKLMMFWNNKKELQVQETMYIVILFINKITSNLSIIYECFIFLYRDFVVISMLTFVNTSFFSAI